MLKSYQGSPCLARTHILEALATSSQSAAYQETGLEVELPGLNPDPPAGDAGTVVVCFPRGRLRTLAAVI